MINQSCGGNSKIAGASFTIAPMSNNFITIILRALEDVDSSKVWMETDDVTTTIRGKIEHIFDVTQAIFLHAASTGVHVSFQSTYSIGCPGDSTGDVYMAEDDVLLNEDYSKDIKQYVSAKFSLYPLGEGKYMDTIYGQIEAMKKRVEVTHAHYSTRLAGEALDIFAGLEAAFRATVESGSSHTVMTVTMSANSPSHKKE